MPAFSSRFAHVLCARTRRDSACRSSYSRRLRSLKLSSSSSTRAILAIRSEEAGDRVRLAVPIPFLPVHAKKNRSTTTTTERRRGNSPVHSLKGSGSFLCGVACPRTAPPPPSGSSTMTRPSAGELSPCSGFPRDWPGWKPIFIMIPNAFLAPGSFSCSARWKRLFPSPSSRDSRSSCRRLFVRFCAFFRSLCCRAS